MPTTLNDDAGHECASIRGAEAGAGAAGARGGAWWCWPAATLSVIAVGLANLLTRAPFPVDETRYLAVAWEMWRGGHALVPHLNGATYAHKPPLLFWLMHGTWALGGVSDIGPRLLPVAFALVSLVLIQRLARCLWPHDATAAQLAPILTAGCLFWMVLALPLMFDGLLSMLTLACLLGVARTVRGHSGGAVLASLALGAAFLAKGPVALVHVGPVALTAAWWSAALEGPRRRTRDWARRLALAFAGAVGIALAWVVPAALVGGPDYARELLWGQSVHRVASSFAHRRPWWWLLVRLPALLLPWTIWPSAWRAVIRGRSRFLRDGGLLLVAIAGVASLVVFSLVSGKQPQYLLPGIPLVAMGLGRLLSEHANERRGIDALAGLAGAFACALVAGWVFVRRGADPGSWVTLVEPGWLVAAAVITIALHAGRRVDLRQRAGLLAITHALVVTALLVAGRASFLARYDLKAPARAVAAWQAEGRPVASADLEHGELNFAGRFRSSLAVLRDLPDARAWLEEHPSGLVLVRFRKGRDLPSAREGQWPLRDGWIVALPADVVDPVRDMPRLGVTARPGATDAPGPG